MLAIMPISSILCVPEKPDTHQSHQAVAVSAIMWVNIKSFIVYRTIISLGEIW